MFFGLNVNKIDSSPVGVGSNWFKLSSQWSKVQMKSKFSARDTQVNNYEIIFRKFRLSATAYFVKGFE